jgi:hypothetical protein
MITLAIIGFIVLFLVSLYLTAITVIILLGTMTYGYVDELAAWTGIAAIVMWVITYWLAPFKIVISYV